MQIRFTLIFTACVFSAFVFFVSGCGSSEAKYIPSEASAKESLNAALRAWQAGQAHGPVKVDAVPVPIDIYDARWQAGTTLEMYEILRTEELDKHKAFIVKTKLKDEDEVQEDTYIVIGNDPLMVFRKQDYDKASGVGGGDGD